MTGVTPNSTRVPPKQVPAAGRRDPFLGGGSIFSAGFSTQDCLSVGKKCHRTPVVNLTVPAQIHNSMGDRQSAGAAVGGSRQVVISNSQVSRCQAQMTPPWTRWGDMWSG